MNSNLEKVVRVLQSRNQLSATSNIDIAYLADIDRKTVSRNKVQIDSYAQLNIPPSQQDIDDVDQRILDKYIQLATTIHDDKYYQRLLGALVAFELRAHTNLIDRVKHTQTAINIGQAFINIALRILGRKDPTVGVPINSQGVDAQVINKHNAGSLFDKSSKYVPGTKSKEWKLTALSNSVVNNVGRLLSNYLQKNVPVINQHMYRSISGQLNLSPLIPPICFTKGGTLYLIDTPSKFFTVSLTLLSQLSLPSQLQLLNLSNPSPASSIDVALSNLASSDEEYGRVYNVFTRLKSSERKMLGYINYDLSSGLQIICFGLLHKHGSGKYQEESDLISAYPTIFQYGTDPSFKSSFRNKIAGQLNKPVDEIKALLTAYSNGSTKSTGGSPELDQFKAESESLRAEVLEFISRYEPEVLELAIMQSKYKDAFPEDMDWEDSSNDSPELARMKSSVFFFVWTYYEKQIRDAMLGVVDDGIPVHDAIYSKQNIPLKDFEEAILKKTGFEVKVSH